MGLELLSLQGYPASEISEAFVGTDGVSGLSELVANRDVSRFAANGMFLPCIGAIIFCFMVNSEGPWWQQSGTASASLRTGTGHQDDPKRRRSA